MIKLGLLSYAEKNFEFIQFLAQSLLLLLSSFHDLRRSNQSILKQINPEYSLEGLILKLKLQCFLATWCKELTHWKRPWCWERLKAGWDGWMESLTQWTWVWASSESWWWTGRPGVLQSMGSESDMTELLINNNKPWFHALKSELCSVLLLCTVYVDSVDNKM